MENKGVMLFPGKLSKQWLGCLESFKGDQSGFFFFLCQDYADLNNVHLCFASLLFLLLVLVYYGCCNKLPQTGWLKTTGMYYRTAGEAGSPESIPLGWTFRAMLLPEAPGELQSLPLPASPGCPTPVSTLLVTLQSPLCVCCTTPVS